MSANQSVMKALALLDCFTLDKPVIGLNELSRDIGLPKATVHRLLLALEECGFVSRSNEFEGDRRYKLGIKLFELGMRVYESIHLSKIAHPYLVSLRDEIGEAAQIVIKDGNEALYLDKVDTEQPFRLYTGKGRKAALYAGASSRVLLASMDDIEIQKILQNPIKKYTKFSPASKRDIMEKITFVRNNGYSVSKEELWEKSIEIAVPVKNHTGEVVASLSTAGPRIRMTDDKIPYFVEKLKEYALKISRELGYTGE